MLKVRFYLTCFRNGLLVVALLALAIGVTPAHAASTITVNSTADNTTADSTCTLREAINNANSGSDTTSGDCGVGSGNDTIIFAGGLGTATITLTSTLPDITDGAGLTIDGDNRITLSGNDSVQVLYVGFAGLLTLRNISITHGSALQGGGLNSDGTVTIIHSAFSNNSSTGSGGGVANGGTATITDSAFSNNSATGSGGGVFNSGTLTIANSTFSNNSANAGGGVTNNSGTATILNSTFSGNSATYEGGGVFTWNGGASPPTTTIRNTILANSAPGYADCYNYPYGPATLIGGNNIIETTSTCNSIATITSDPMLGSLAGFPAYFPLNAGSPAIDAGDDAVCTAAPVSNTSQNGLTRPQGAHCDIGSVELVRIYLPLIVR